MPAYFPLLMSTERLFLRRKRTKHLIPSLSVLKIIALRANGVAWNPASGIAILEAFGNRLARARMNAGGSIIAHSAFNIVSRRG